MPRNQINTLSGAACEQAPQSSSSEARSAGQAKYSPRLRRGEYFNHPALRSSSKEILSAIMAMNSLLVGLPLALDTV